MTIWILLALALALYAAFLLFRRSGRSPASLLGVVFGVFVGLLVLRAVRGGVPAWGPLLMVIAVSSLVLVAARTFRGAPKRARGIPRGEIATLGSTVKQADELAAAGDPTAGFAQLSAGLERARSVLREGQPWGGELVHRWEEVVRDYAAEYPLRPSREIIPAAAPAGTGTEGLPSGAAADARTGTVGNAPAQGPSSA
jgi:hypothetical protein